MLGKISLDLTIGLTGVIALWLTLQVEVRLKKYACLFGLIGQPFWVWTSVANQQWGILALTAAYTYLWVKSFKQYWLAWTQEPNN